MGQLLYNNYNRKQEVTVGISKELQEVITAIERLNPEWKADGTGSCCRKWITFVKNTKDGTYEGKIVIDYFGQRLSDYAEINVTLLSEAGKTILFSEEYIKKKKEFQYLERYIENNQAYREEILRQKLEKTRMREAEQKIKEIEKEAKDRFLGRKT